MKLKLWLVEITIALWERRRRKLKDELVTVRLKLAHSKTMRDQIKKDMRYL